MHLLVAVDGSEESDRALEYAMDIAAATAGTITILHVVHPDIYDAGGGEPASPADRRDRLIIDSLDAAEEQGRAILDDAIESATTRGHSPTGEFLYGEPAQTIADHAEIGGFDTIYVGHRGRSDRTIEVLGSVARDLVERASIPVTVVK